MRDGDSWLVARDLDMKESNRSPSNVKLRTYKIPRAKRLPAQPLLLTCTRWPRPTLANKLFHKMHPLVRDLYKRVLHAGKNYPTGLEHVKQVWKAALRNPQNCPACFSRATDDSVDAHLGGRQLLRTETNNMSSKTQISHRNGVVSSECEREIRAAVARGRHMVKEMVGVSQLKKYRSMRKRYGADGTTRSYREATSAGADHESLMALKQLEESASERFLP